MNKQDTRKYFKSLRDNLLPQEAEERSNSIIKRILISKEYKDCKKVFTYINFSSEVETIPLIKKALEDEKIVAVPWVDKENMYFIEIKSLENLVLSKFGILEPVFDKDNVIVSNNETIAIVPGLAFDRHNYRLGYGGGYYDKYFSKNQFMKKIGVCYDFQRVDILKVEEYDMPIDLIITDTI